MGRALSLRHSATTAWKYPFAAGEKFGVAKKFPVTDSTVGRSHSIEGAAWRVFKSPFEFPDHKYVKL